MVTSHKYEDIWRACVPFILNTLTSNEANEVVLPQKLFNAVGSRETSGFGFSLYYVSGIQTRSLGSSAVARDLDRVLKATSEFVSIIQTRTVSITFSEFKLRIE